MLSERNLSDVVTPLLELAPTGRVPYAAYIAAIARALGNLSAFAPDLATIS